MTRHFLHQLPFLMDNFAFLADDIWLFIFGALATPVMFMLGKQFISGARSNPCATAAPIWMCWWPWALSPPTSTASSSCWASSSASAMWSANLDYFESTAVILTLVTLGKLLEARAKGRTSAAIKKLMGLAPKTATLPQRWQRESHPHRRKSRPATSCWSSRASASRLTPS